MGMDASPASVVYLNGAYLPKGEARLPVEDRGTLFGDGVYEVIAYYNGRPVALAQHVRRLRESLRGVRIAPPEPSDVARLGEITGEVLRRSGLRDAKVYWQVTRGAAARDLAFPKDVPPSVLVMAYPLAPLSLEPSREPRAMRAILAPDVRWRNCWMKTVMLLPNMLAQNEALERGCDVAIFERDGVVTETTAANLFIVRGGELRTHPLDGRILGGITREIVIELARGMGIAVREECFRTEDLFAADEAFITSTTTHGAPVIEVDGKRIGSGGRGETTRRVHAAFTKYAMRECGV